MAPAHQPGFGTSNFFSIVKVKNAVAGIHVDHDYAMSRTGTTGRTIRVAAEKGIKRFLHPLISMGLAPPNFFHFPR